jgi:DNA-binding XRE family transcriptional regulator
MTIYKIENGKGANLKTLKKLSDLFECTINELFDFKEEEK